MVDVPVLEVEPGIDNVTLLFNKFGDPDVDHYNIYSGRSQNPTTILDTSKTTLKKIYGLENGSHWIRVTAVNHSSQESGYSNQVQVYVNSTNPGDNLVINGDFSDGKNGWTWELQGSGEGEWSIDDGAAQIDISNAGSNVYDVQIRQNNILLIQGHTYVFEFDAWADASRSIEAKVGQDVSPYTNYSQLGPTFITPIPQQFSYEFNMESAIDANARVVFNCGQSSPNVTIDNVSLKLVDTSVPDEIQAVPNEYVLYPNFPNPFNPETQIDYKLPEENCVLIRVYNVLGKLVQTLVDEKQMQGRYHVLWDGTDLSGVQQASGLYIIQLQAGSFRAMKKITLLR